MSNGGTASLPNNTAAGKPLEVRLVTPPEPVDPRAQMQRFFAVLALSLTIVLLAGWSVIYLSPVISAVLYPPARANVWFALAQPKFLAIGDEGVIEVTATSIAQEPITATTTLAFTPYSVTAGSLVIPVNLSAGSNNVFKLDNLAPFERRISNVKFQVGLNPQSLFVTGQITPSLQMSISAQPGMYYNLKPVELWPLPYSRLLVTAALTGLLGFAVGLLKDEFKKWITGSDSSN